MIMSNGGFGDKKVTQAEVAMFFTQAMQPRDRKLQAVENAIASLLAYLAEVGISGEKLLPEQLAAFVNAHNAEAEKKKADRLAKIHTGKIPGNPAIPDQPDQQLGPPEPDKSNGSA